MLFVSLITSAVFLLLANRIVRRSTAPGTAMALTSLGFLIGPFCLGFFLPPVVIQAPLLYVATIFCRHSHRDARHFLGLSLGATLLAYAGTGILVYRADRDFARLRTRYAYESMEGRVPRPRRHPAESKFPAATEARLAEIESQVNRSVSDYRDWQLRLLHEDSVRLFVNSPGFGVTRLGTVNESWLSAGILRGPLPLQPAAPSGATWSPGDSKPMGAGDEAPLGRLLEASILDFVNPGGFGFFKDRRHVAGFEPHRFGWEVPTAKGPWQVRRLELISLLLHDEPAVYVSEHLPAMDRLHAIPTRPLDRFERYGLEPLQRGEDLFISQSGRSLRMLGAVRSVKQCIACHGGTRGNLLGVFSYTLASIDDAEPQLNGEPFR